MKEAAACVTDGAGHAAAAKNTDRQGLAAAPRRPAEGRLEYEIVRSRRRTVSLQVTRDGRVVVRCPMRTPARQIREFVESHADWVRENVEKARRRQEDLPVFTEKEIRQYRETARRVLTAKTELWAARMGVAYGRIAIRQQATRWGSCSAKGNLNYNWVLILVPEELQDYVVVHELAHRREMNHSPRFWKIVAEQLPDYAVRRKRLKEYAGYTDIQAAPEETYDFKMDGIREKSRF